MARQQPESVADQLPYACRYASGPFVRHVGEEADHPDQHDEPQRASANPLDFSAHHLSPPRCPVKSKNPYRQLPVGVISPLARAVPGEPHRPAHSLSTAKT